MDDVGEVLSFGDELSDGGAVFGVEELVGADEAECSGGVEEAEPLLDENDVDVVVALLGGAVEALVDFDFEGGPLFINR